MRDVNGCLGPRGSSHERFLLFRSIAISRGCRGPERQQRAVARKRRRPQLQHQHRDEDRENPVREHTHPFGARSANLGHCHAHINKLVPRIIASWGSSPGVQPPAQLSTGSLCRNMQWTHLLNFILAVDCLLPVLPSPPIKF